ncbi:MAG: DUF2891 family protein [Nitrospirales bacterium]
MLKLDENPEPPISWEKFCIKRKEYLIALGDVVEQGIKQKDTTHPVFCGCIDWHSSVHGTYALLTAARLSEKSQWVEVVESLLTPKQLAEELAYFQGGELDHELPYGYAWFLKLALERERWGGQTDLLPLATAIAQRLEQWLFPLTDDEILHHVLRREYGNLSWAVLNLWEWSQWKNNTTLCEKLKIFTRTRLVKLDTNFPLSYDEYTDEFFAASLQRTRTILSILEPEDSQAWLSSFGENLGFLNPLQAAPRPHSGGLNFSRAWSFWALFQVTGDEMYRDMYVSHIVTHMDSPQYWRDDYKKYSHWVPQFGIYAIALSIKEMEIESNM